MTAGVTREQLARLVEGAHHDPHSILGAHPDPASGGTVVRALRSLAASIEVVLPDGRRFPLRHEYEGVFAGSIPQTVTEYQLAATYDDDSESRVLDDPYRFLPTLGEVDTHLFREGRHEDLWRVLGAHARSYDTAFGVVTGTSFAVWAPNARGVRVVGDFNHWDGRGHPMRSLGASGIWELFVPGVADGARYKFAVHGADSAWREKADPLAFATEQPPATASVVFTSSYEWGDAGWLARRGERLAVESPMSVYEVHLGSWRKGLGYRELAEELVEYVRDMGFTHVEFLPVAEHPYGGSWGYQVSSYFAPTSRFGSPDDFRFLVDRLHRAGIGVLIDWVPAHFPRDEWALGRFDGTPLYEHSDPTRGEHPDWGTYVFDFGRPEVRNFLVANAVYWLEEFHIDGLRVDAVASMLYLDYSRGPGEWRPNEYGGRENLDAVSFLQEMNATVYRRAPGIVTIAEESTSWPGVSRPTHIGGLGFGFKWNMGWMHDTLTYIRHDPIYRQFHHHQMTFAMAYAYADNYLLPLSHDEVVHGKGSLLRKMPGDRREQLAGVRSLLAFMWAHPGKQLLFMGGELAQDAEWADDRSLDWWLEGKPEHEGVRSLVRDLNRLYRDSPALWSQDQLPTGFDWIEPNDAAGNVFSFLRHGSDGSALACVANFAGVPRDRYHVGLPRAGRWREVLNTDGVEYGGGGSGNQGHVKATSGPRHGQPASTRLYLAPLSVLWLVPEVGASGGLSSGKRFSVRGERPL